MTLLDEGTTLLRDTETKLRALASRALAEGHYDELIHLADLARRLDAVLESAAAASPSDAGQQAGKSNDSPAEQPPTTSVAPSGRRAARREATGGKYPRFVREGDQIVKIGWSKRARAEYEHKAPYEVLAAFMGKLGNTGRRFTMEHLLPLRLAEGRDIPSYQAYLGLAWFRACGLVHQHGRKGYSVPNRKDLAARMRTEWSHLSER